MKTAEEAQVPSRAPKWFQSQDLKWSQPTGSQVPWYVSIPGFLAIAGSCICCYNFLSYLSGEFIIRDQEISIHMQKRKVGGV